MVVVVLLVLTRMLQGVGRTPGNVVVLLSPELGLLLHASPTNRSVVSKLSRRAGRAGPKHFPVSLPLLNAVAVPFLLKGSGVVHAPSVLSVDGVGHVGHST